MEVADTIPHPSRKFHDHLLANSFDIYIFFSFKLTCSISRRY